MPKQAPLPGMENRQLKDLHDVATEYAEIRDERMRLGGEEVELKAKLLELMKKHKKQTYCCDGVEVKIVHEEETVKVKILKSEHSNSDIEPPPQKAKNGKFPDGKSAGAN